MLQKLTFLLLLFTSTFWAQDVLEKVAEETCECSKSIDSHLDSNQLQLQLGLCIIQSYQKNETALLKKYGSNMSIGNSIFEKFAEDVGIKMTLSCPHFISLIAENESFLNEIIDEEYDNAEIFEVRGIIQKAEAKEFLTVHLQTDDNSTLKLLFLYDIPNSNILRDTQNLPQKKVDIQYSKMELYDPAIDDFRSFNIIDTINWAD